MEGEWYNELNDKVTISLTSTGLILGDYLTNIELLTGSVGMFTLLFLIGVFIRQLITCLCIFALYKVSCLISIFHFFNVYIICI